MNIFMRMERTNSGVRLIQLVEDVLPVCLIHHVETAAADFTPPSGSTREKSSTDLLGKDLTHRLHNFDGSG